MRMGALERQMMRPKSLLKLATRAYTGHLHRSFDITVELHLTGTSVILLPRHYGLAKRRYIFVIKNLVSAVTH